MDGAAVNRFTLIRQRQRQAPFQQTAEQQVKVCTVGLDVHGSQCQDLDCCNRNEEIFLLCGQSHLNRVLLYPQTSLYLLPFLRRSSFSLLRSLQQSFFLPVVCVIEALKRLPIQPFARFGATMASADFSAPLTASLLMPLAVNGGLRRPPGIRHCSFGRRDADLPPCYG